MATVVIIGDGHGLRIEARHKNQPNKRKLSLYKLLFSLLNGLYSSNEMECFIYKGGCRWCWRMRIEVFKRRAGLHKLQINGFMLLVI